MTVRKKLICLILVLLDKHELIFDETRVATYTRVSFLGWSIHWQVQRFQLIVSYYFNYLVVLEK